MFGLASFLLKETPM